MNYLYVALFLVLLVASYYYTKTHNFWNGLLGLVVISYIQGILIASIFYHENFTLLFVSSVGFALMYYLLITNLAPLIHHIIQIRKSSNSQEYTNEDVIKRCLSIWNISPDKFSIRMYEGKYSFNAFTSPYGSEYRVMLGQELLETINDDEVVFTISHELAHNLHSRRDLALTWVSLGALIGVAYLLSYLLLFFKIATPALTLVLYFFLFIFGIVSVNFLQWIDEYGADRIAVEKTRDATSAISALEKFSQKIGKMDHGMIPNLIMYDHPLMEDRIIKIQELP